MKKTPRNLKQKTYLSLLMAGEVREAGEVKETPRRLKIKPRNLKEKQESPKKKPREAGTLKENNLKEKAPSRLEQIREFMKLDPYEYLMQTAGQDDIDNYYKYLRQIKESECFYVEKCNLGIIDDDMNSKLFPCDDKALARSAAKFALGKHNKDKGTKLYLVRVVRAVMQQVDGYNMWITLEASDHCFYEAHTYSQIYEDHCAAHSLYFFRPAKFKQKLESSMDVDDHLEWYNDFSQFVNADLDLNNFSSDERWEYFKYLDQFMKSECFEVDYWDFNCAQLVKPCSDMALAKSAAEFALDKHNKEKGEKLKLESVVRATEHKGDDRYILWITLKASDNRFYEAKTFSEGMNCTVHSLDFFRLAKYYSN